jgi:hypothetical protein
MEKRKYLTPAENQTRPAQPIPSLSYPSSWSCIYKRLICCHVYHWLRRGFWSVIGFIEYLLVITTIMFYTIYYHSTPISSVCLHYSSPIYNTGTIKVSINYTLPIPLHYSTHKVFKSHMKSSQADLFNSSVLLVQICSLLACLFACFCRYYSLITVLNWLGMWIHFSYKHSAETTHRNITQTTQRKVTWFLASVIIGLLSPSNEQ